MYLEKLHIINFKSHQEADLSFSPKINCLVGNNGVGKTNLLDAIHYLSLTKSFFNAVDSQNISFNEDFFVIQGVFQKNEYPEEIYCGLKRGKRKQLKRNKKEYEKISDHVGLFPVVMVSPSDIGLILDGSEERRKFINAVISQFDKSYLEDTMAYNKVLTHRNKLLKDLSGRSGFDVDSLEIWDDQLVMLGDKIFEKRKQFIEDLIPIFQEYYTFVSGGNEEVSLEYKSDLFEGNFHDILKASRKKDLILQYTSKGIHKDDLVFNLANHPIKKTGSQGQQKTYLVALKLAKFEFINHITHCKPILLLDDVFDKFDDHRVKRIIEMVSENKFGQIFITDTSQERVQSVMETLKVPYTIYRLEDDGHIKEITSYAQE
ncbi:MAG: DNA replication/repair protein RecF [Bacteroidota bacterium]